MMVAISCTSAVSVLAVESRGTICIDHGPFDVVCSGYSLNERQTTHYFTYNGYRKKCDYYTYNSYDAKKCIICGNTERISSYHIHGERGHDEYCGGTNWMGCSID